jgi:hypothetical protein
MENVHAERLFNAINKIIKQALGNGITNGAQLDKLGKMLFGNAWQGIYAADTIKSALSKANSRGAYIVNTDNSTGAGIHWVGIYVFSNAKLVFDSFGRKTKDILVSLASPTSPDGLGAVGGLVDTDYDKNQLVKQQDCGSRAMAFLCVAHYWGYEIARWI